MSMSQAGLKAPISSPMAQHMLSTLQSFNPNPPNTVGLSSDEVQGFFQSDPRLGEAIGRAHDRHALLVEQGHGDLLRLPEQDMLTRLQEGILRFYNAELVNPYVPLASKGPWLVTTSGSVLFNTGNYGMNGLGDSHSVFDGTAAPEVMANVMTASFAQRRFIDNMWKELGHTRTAGEKHFKQFAFLNSGSEAVDLALVMADLNTKRRMDAKKWTKRPVTIVFGGAFHGRTGRASRLSVSCSTAYEKYLASFADHRDVRAVPANNAKSLERAFARAAAEKRVVNACVFEPVGGEGNPGKALWPSVYKVARRLCDQTGSMLIIDSIQAGLRTFGHLSVMDYPGFRDLPGPDMETWSKALNAGMYPLSVLGMTEGVAQLYPGGVYGNTMTGNPRAMNFGSTVLENITPEMRTNIRQRGKEVVRKFRELQKQYPKDIVNVTGTGLLFAVHLNPERHIVEGTMDSVEQDMRRHGISVIHGGTNALRFTPSFDITSAQVDLLVTHVRKAIGRSLLEGPLNQEKSKDS